MAKAYAVYLARMCDEELAFRLESKGAVLIEGPKLTLGTVLFVTWSACFESSSRRDLVKSRDSMRKLGRCVFRGSRFLGNAKRLPTGFPAGSLGFAKAPWCKEVRPFYT